MSLKLSGHLFTGPFPVDATEVRANQVPVVYAIIAKGGPSWAPVFRIVHIGSSTESGTRLAEHPNRADWSAKPGESLAVYLFYTRRSEYSAADREQLAERLRRLYSPPNDSIQ
jgi:hypothetical protein